MKCLCREVDWFHQEPRLPYILTICCPIHGDPNGLQPYEPPKMKIEEKKEDEREN